MSYPSSGSCPWRARPTTKAPTRRNSAAFLDETLIAIQVAGIAIVLTAKLRRRRGAVRRAGDAAVAAHGRRRAG
jgi:hypothetical protein